MNPFLPKSMNQIDACGREAVQQAAGLNVRSCSGRWYGGQ